MDLKVMGPAKDLTEHSFPCWECSLMILKVNGPNILAPWFMPIIAPIVMPQALVHTIFYMEDIHCYPSISNLMYLFLNFLKLLPTNMFKN